MAKNSYWLIDPSDGSYAYVEGAAERDKWVKVHGWTEAENEPGPTDQVHLRNESPDLGPSKLPRQAAEDPKWAALGWAPGAPPEPVNAAIAHWPKPERAPAEPDEKAEAKPDAKPARSNRSATSGENKE